MHFQDELSDVVDVKDPDKTPVCERRKERLAAEAAKFDSDHYLWVLFNFTWSSKSISVEIITSSMDAWF